jgi:hypothetical protein
MQWLWASLLRSFTSLIHSFAIRNQDCSSSGLTAFTACRKHSCASLRKRFASVSLVCDRDYFQVYKLKVLGRERGNRKKAYH